MRKAKNHFQLIIKSILLIGEDNISIREKESHPFPISIFSIPSILFWLIATFDRPTISLDTST